MLLLVLIFVLAAFGLLLVALVTGTAVWAWASVAVSVVAAGMLVFDWAQRRAAVNEGVRGGTPVPTPSSMADSRTTMLPPTRGRVDPATQVLRPTHGAGAYPGVGGPPGPTQYGVPAPPVSPGQPPSAAPIAGQPGGDQSPSVTPPAKARDKSQAWQAAISRAEPIHTNPGDAASADAAASAGASEPPAGEQAAAKTDDATAAPDAAAQPAAGGGKTDDAAGSKQPAQQADARPADAPQPAAQSEEAQSEKAQQPEKPAEPAKVAEPEKPAKVAEPEKAAAKEPAAGDADKTQAIVPVGTPSEPGEERTNPAAAATVAKLTDEVFVIDEEPRFHLASCRVLIGRETIPLPVKEAVEYEFTPCAVCSPVRTLAVRNRTASKS